MPRMILFVSLIFWSVPVSSPAFADTVVRAAIITANRRIEFTPWTSAVLARGLSKSARSNTIAQS